MNAELVAKQRRSPLMQLRVEKGIVNMIVGIILILVPLNKKIDDMYHPLIEEDSNSNPALILLRKTRGFFYTNIFDSVLLFENVCEVHL